ncbi:MAG: hypothetical protein ACHQRM_10470 [Bacteroidia bacterium]
MKKTVLTLLTLLYCLVLSAQYYHKPRASYDKYYIGASVGSGTAYWDSHLHNNDLLNKDGSVLVNGQDIHFKAKNSTQVADINVQFPLYLIRYGFGLSFENFSLDKLSIQNQQSNTIVLMDEQIVFDKMYAQIEFPFFPRSKSPFSINANFHIGYFGYHGVKRLNLFGGDHLATSYFGTLGVTADYRLYPHVYFFVMPFYELKYYQSSSLDGPALVRHNISTVVFTGGLRVDLTTY